MRLSVKGRYAVAAMILLAQSHETGEFVTVSSLSGRLGISKIYLEQVFSLLRRSGLVVSVKGAQGGYRIQGKPWQITALEILAAVETSLFEEAEDTVKEQAPDVESALAQVYTGLDTAVREALGGLTLQDLVTTVQNYTQEQGPMYYI